MDEPSKTAPVIERCSPPSKNASATTPLSLEGWSQAHLEAMEDLRRATPLKTGWPRMQAICNPRSGRFWTVGGNPGNYKTLLMWNLALDLALAHHRVLYVALEPPRGDLALHALCRFSGVNHRRIEAAQRDEGTLTDGEEQSVERATARLKDTELYLRIHDPRHGRSLQQVLASCTRARWSAIFVDHVGMIGRDQGSGLEYLETAIDRMRALAHGELTPDYTPFVCGVSPLNRDSPKDPDRVPRLSDFRGSSRLEYDADLCMMLRKRPRERDSDDSTEPDTVDAFVLKNRHGRPTVLQFAARGDIAFVTERPRDSKPEPEPEQEERYP